MIVALEHRAQRLDLSGGPIREIGEGALAGAAAFAQENGGAGVAVGHSLDINGRSISSSLTSNKLAIITWEHNTP